ncbi:MAG: hypothetical protein PHS31_04430 [Victivallaceae bacterium]|nr:hypothetical protein [Victivallaceae bacterium]MDD4180570.1 hypothetical protein [Victivallaceae bacterium]
MTDVFILLIIFVGIFTQSVLGTAGIYLPIMALLLFYIAVNFNIIRTLFYALLCGILADAASGYQFPCHIFIYSLLPLLGLYWVKIHDLRPLYLNFFPGILVAAIQIIPLALIRFRFDDPAFQLFHKWIPILLAGIIFGALFMPLAIAILDYFAHALKVTRYQDAGSKPQAKSRRWY